MSASESSPLAANLQESIEHLIAETVRRSQADNDEENQKLRAALSEALREIETGQAAMARAAAALNTVLSATTSLEPLPETDHAAIVSTESAEAAATTAKPSTEVPATPIETTSEPAAAETATPSQPGELDVIAHDVTISLATGLQSLLRDQLEVETLRTREFVNGELRLQLNLNSGLNLDALNSWLQEHDGKISAHTSSVLELRFDNK